MTINDTDFQERSVVTNDEQASSPFLDFNAEKYLGHIDEFDMTEEQKRELLGTLWSIMCSFVQLGFDLKNCGQILESFAEAAQGDSDAVHSLHSPQSGAAIDVRGEDHD